MTRCNVRLIAGSAFDDDLRYVFYVLHFAAVRYWVCALSTGRPESPVWTHPRPTIGARFIVKTREQADPNSATPELL
jgi:hypothetical protein